MFFLWLPPCKKIGVRILADSNNINLRESRVYVRRKAKLIHYQQQWHRGVSLCLRSSEIPSPCQYSPQGGE